MTDIEINESRNKFELDYKLMCVYYSEKTLKLKLDVAF